MGARGQAGFAGGKVMKKVSSTATPQAGAGPRAALQRFVKKPWVRKWWPAFAVGGVALIVLSVVVFRGKPVRGSAFGREAFPLLQQESVQKDLELSLDQVGRITLMNQQRQAAREAMLDLPREERDRKALVDSAAAEKEIRALLEPQQLVRLKQILLQQRGTRAWGDEEVVRALKLSHDQRVELATIREEYDTKRRDLQKIENKQEQQKKADALRQSIDERLLAVLTPTQQEKWDELIGPKFAGELRRGPDPGPTGPNAPGGQNGGGRRGGGTKGKGGAAKAK
jgi:hypothetical protein